MGARYDYTARMRYLGQETEVRAATIVDLARLLGMSHVKVLELLHGSSTHRSKWNDRVTVSRSPRRKRT